MTSKKFWGNPYQTSLTSTITALSGEKVQLSKTIYFAESGGQESDRGTIGGIPVVKAEKLGKTITYVLEAVPNFEIGQEVLVVIDWPRRYSLMRLHFAAEVVLELFYRKCEGIHKIGAHIAEDKSRIDFEWPENISPLLADVQREAQRLIDADLPIESNFTDEVDERRCWKIEGFAQVSCGGTHLSRTSEVGHITLKRKNVGKGKERVEIYVSE